MWFQRRNAVLALLCLRGDVCNSYSPSFLLASGRRLFSVSSAPCFPLLPLTSSPPAPYSSLSSSRSKTHYSSLPLFGSFAPLPRPFFAFPLSCSTCSSSSSSSSRLFSTAPPSSAPGGPAPPVPEPLAVHSRPSPSGQCFVAALLEVPTSPVPGSTVGMELWELHSPLAHDSPPRILLPSRVRDFWTEAASHLLKGRSIAAVGFPGAGKTSTSPYLLRLLLQTGRPVVFDDHGATYYEFRPRTGAGGGGYDAFEYDADKVTEGTIPALADDKAFLLIDDPIKERGWFRWGVENWVKASFALVCSTDSRYYNSWRDSDDSKKGFPRHLPLYFPGCWSITELLEARPYMLDANACPILATEDAVEERVEAFGFMPGQVFSESIAAHKALQSAAIDKLRKYDVIKMCIEGFKTGSDFDDSGGAGMFTRFLPSKNYIDAFESEHPFTSRKVVVASSYAAAEIWRRHETVLLSLCGEGGGSRSKR